MTQENKPEAIPQNIDREQVYLHRKIAKLDATLETLIKFITKQAVSQFESALLSSPPPLSPPSPPSPDGASASGSGRSYTSSDRFSSSPS